MSFDLFFLSARTDQEIDEVLRERKTPRPATADEEARMEQILAGLLAMSPNAQSRPAPKGPSYGFWVENGDFPDLEIRPRHGKGRGHGGSSGSHAS